MDFAKENLQNEIDLTILLFVKKGRQKKRAVSRTLLTKSRLQKDNEKQYGRITT